MDGIEFKELFKVATETLREKTIHPLLKQIPFISRTLRMRGLQKRTIFSWI